MQSALAGGTTGPCTAPEGKIDIEPSQKCNGKYTVAIGKDITLKAVSLKDKDCYCGRGVEDTINTATGVRWSVGGGIGTLDGGTDGTPKKYTAPRTTHTNVAVRLQVNDEATAPETYDDGGFTEVTSLNLDVVIPNRDVSTLDASSACPGGIFGVDHRYKSTLSRIGCTVDFSGLETTETGCTETQNTCGYPPGSTGNGCGNGTVWLVVDSSNVYRHDRLSNCASINPKNCVLKRTLYWAIRASGGGNYSLPNHIATFNIPAAGANSTTTSRIP